MFKKLLPFLGIALVLTLVAGAFNLKPAFASTAPNSVSNSLSADPLRQGPGGPENDTYLLQALGITAEQYQAAQQKALAAALAQAVKDGQITQAQADLLSKENRGWRGFPGLESVDFDKYLAEALGLTTAKLQTARQAAQSARLDQEVSDGRLSQEQADQLKAQRALAADSTFQSAMKSAYSAALDKAVSAGLITRAQADLLLKNYTGFGLPGMGGPGMGGPGGRQGHDGMGERGGMPPQAPSPAATQPVQ